MRHPKALQWEARLKAVFDRIDAELEARYGGEFARHPARPEPGGTSNPEHDGLFNVGAAFSAGYGSPTGPGYVVEVRLATLTQAPADRREEIAAEVARRLAEELPRAFPERALKVTREGAVYKIHGDLALGPA